LNATIFPSHSVPAEVVITTTFGTSHGPTQPLMVNWTRCFGSAEEFLESGLHRQAACLITDILMPKMSGLELQTRLQDEECDIPIIFITAYGDAAMRIQAMREGAVEFLAKPFDHQLMLKTVRAALDL
jgi:two-component system response regulator FixJ